MPHLHKVEQELKTGGVKVSLGFRDSCGDYYKQVKPHVELMTEQTEVVRS